MIPRRLRWPLAIGVFAWLATACFVVPARQHAVVTSGGRFVTTDDSDATVTTVRLYAPGVHVKPPWPWGAAVTLSLRESTLVRFGETDAEPESFLDAGRVDRKSQFLTGDRNLLQLGGVVQYRVDPARVGEFLRAGETVPRRLRLAAMAHLSSLISASGVDAIHPRGAGPLGLAIAGHLRNGIAAELGVVIDDVQLDRLTPPAQVRAEFLEVVDARSRAEQQVQSATAAAEDRATRASADAERMTELAARDAAERITQAQALAKRVTSLLEGIEDDAEIARVMRRLHRSAVNRIVASAKRTVLLDADEPVDLSIIPARPQRRPVEEQKPEAEPETDEHAEDAP